jgi:hypothetical protein
VLFPPNVSIGPVAGNVLFVQSDSIILYPTVAWVTDVQIPAKLNLVNKCPGGRGVGIRLTLQSANLNSNISPRVRSNWTSRPFFIFRMFDCEMGKLSLNGRISAI